MKVGRKELMNKEGKEERTCIRVISDQQSLCVSPPPWTFAFLTRLLA
jgi:hypothetical protein